MSVAIDLILAAIFGFSVWRGLKNGIVRGVCGILALIVSIYAANLIATAYSGEFTGMLKPFVGGVVDTVISDVLGDKGLPDETASRKEMYELAFSALRTLGMSEKPAGLVAESAAADYTLSASGLSESINEKLSSALAYAAVFGICFSLCAIVFAVIGNLVNRVFSIPGLERLDSLLGALFGLARGLILIYVIALVIRYIGLMAAPIIEKTILLKYLINVNPIAGILGI